MLPFLLERDVSGIILNYLECFDILPLLPVVSEPTLEALLVSKTATAMCVAHHIGRNDLVLPQYIFTNTIDIVLLATLTSHRDHRKLSDIFLFTHNLVLIDENVTLLRALSKREMLTVVDMWNAVIQSDCYAHTTRLDLLVAVKMVPRIAVRMLMSSGLVFDTRPLLVAIWIIAFNLDDVDQCVSYHQRIYPCNAVFADDRVFIEQIQMLLLTRPDKYAVLDTILYVLRDTCIGKHFMVDGELQCEQVDTRYQTFLSAMCIYRGRLPDHDVSCRVAQLLPLTAYEACKLFPSKCKEILAVCLQAGIVPNVDFQFFRDWKIRTPLEWNAVHALYMEGNVLWAGLLTSEFADPLLVAQFGPARLLPNNPMFQTTSARVQARCYVEALMHMTPEDEPAVFKMTLSAWNGHAIMNGVPILPKFAILRFLCQQRAHIYNNIGKIPIRDLFPDAAHLLFFAKHDELFLPHVNSISTLLHVDIVFLANSLPLSVLLYVTSIPRSKNYMAIIRHCQGAISTTK